MIYINCALKQEDIIAMFDMQNIEGIEYKFIKKQGIKLVFEISGTNLNDAVSITKKTIKSSEFGAALFFNVSM